MDRVAGPVGKSGERLPAIPRTGAPLGAPLAPSSSWHMRSVMPGSDSFVWLPAWLGFDLCVQTGVDGTPRVQVTPENNPKWADCGGGSVKPQNKACLFLEHLFFFFFTKEGNSFILKKCDGVRCAEFRRF